MAESRIIAVAIEHHLKSLDDGKLCRTKCMDLTESGAGNEYLCLGRAERFEGNMYCGPELLFNSCRFFNKKTELQNVSSQAQAYVKH